MTRMTMPASAAASVILLPSARNDFGLGVLVERDVLRQDEGLGAHRLLSPPLDRK
jgi:hypothetical protein